MEDIEERRENCVAHRKDTESNADDISDLKKTVYGNGTPGLKERVTIMETNFSAVGKGVGYAVTILGVLQLLVGAAVSIVVYVVSSGKHP